MSKQFDLKDLLLFFFQRNDSPRFTHIQDIYKNLRAFSNVHETIIFKLSATNILNVYCSAFIMNIIP